MGEEGNRLVIVWTTLYKNPHQLSQNVCGKNACHGCYTKKIENKKTTLSYNIYNIYKAAYISESPSWKGEMSHLFLKSKREIMPTCKCKLPHILKERVSEVRTISRLRMVMYIYVQVASCFSLPWVKWDIPRMEARSGPHLLPCPKPFGLLPTLGFYPTHYKKSVTKGSIYFTSGNLHFITRFGNWI